MKFDDLFEQRTLVAEKLKNVFVKRDLPKYLFQKKRIFQDRH